MKMIPIIFIVMSLLVSCNEDENAPAPDFKGSDPIGVEPPFIPDAIHMSANREYDPDIFEVYEDVFNYNAVAVLPQYVNVHVGNAGHGFASIIVGDLKYCYRGNKELNSIEDGDAFELEFVQSDLVGNCVDKISSVPVYKYKEVSEGDILRFKIEGNACEGPLGGCDYIEADAEILIEPIEESP